MTEVDPYIYPGTSTLINKLGIRDQATLNQIEIKISAIRIGELAKNAILGKFDYQHLKDIHKHIFKDIYAFAGIPRTIGLSKKEAVLNHKSVPYPHTPKTLFNRTTWLPVLIMLLNNLKKMIF